MQAGHPRLFWISTWAAGERQPMDIEEKKPIEFYRSQPERYQILKNGAVRDRTKSQSAIVAIFPELNPYTITPERSREFLERRRAIGLRSALEGLALVLDVDPSEIDDELLLQAGSALAAIVASSGKAALKSNNIRGQAEYIRFLASLFGIDSLKRAEEMEPPPPEMPTIFILLNQYVNQLQEGKEDNSKAVDGEILEEQKGG